MRTLCMAALLGAAMLPVTTLGSVAVAGCACEDESADESDAPVAKTVIKDKKAANRLRRNSGVTLQWSGWNKRGRLKVTETQGVMRLSGSQSEPGGKGMLEIDGLVTEIGTGYFEFTGLIQISDSPDVGRSCRRSGPATFKVTKNRKYWRMQNMEVCDGLTDYVDIYF